MMKKILFIFAIALCMMSISCQVRDLLTVEDEVMLSKNFDNDFQYAVMSIHVDSKNHGAARNWIYEHSKFKRDQKKVKVDQKSYEAALKLTHSDHIIISTLGYCVLSHSKRKEAYPIVLDGMKKYQMKSYFFTPKGLLELGDDTEKIKQRIVAFGALGGAIIELEPFLDDKQRDNLNNYLKSNLDDDIGDDHSENSGFNHTLFAMMNSVENFTYLIKRAERHKNSKSFEIKTRCFNALQIFKNPKCIDVVMETIPRHLNDENNFLIDLGVVLYFLTESNPEYKKVVGEKLLKMYEVEPDQNKKINILKLLAQYTKDSPEARTLLQTTLSNIQNRAERIDLANTMLDFAPDIACPILEKERHFYTLFRHDPEKYLGGYLDFLIEKQLSWYDTHDLILKLPKESYIPHIKKFEKLLEAVDPNSPGRPDYDTRCTAWICIYRTTGECRKVVTSYSKDPDVLRGLSARIIKELKGTHLNWKDYVVQPPYNKSPKRRLR